MARDNKAPPPSIAKAFDLTTPPAYLRAAENPAAFRALAGIEKRAEQLRQRALDHYKRFEDRWTAKEAMRLFTQHHAQSAFHPAPTGVSRHVSPEALMKIASRHVQARTNRRLAKINAISTRLSNAVVRNLESMSLKRSFDGASPDGSGPAQSPRRTR